MDFQLLNNNSIRIKSKKASFVVDPVKEIGKTSADGVLSLSKGVIDVSRVADSRIVISASGEYEVGGVKISGFAVEQGISYSINADNIFVVLGKVSNLKEAQDKTFSCQIALLNADEDPSAVVAKLEPKIVILYGEKKSEGAKALGKDVSPVNKFSAKDSFPAEMEVIILG